MKNVDELLRIVFCERFQISDVCLRKEEIHMIHDDKYYQHEYVYEVWFYLGEKKERQVVHITKEQYDELSEAINKQYTECSE